MENSVFTELFFFVSRVPPFKTIPFNSSFSVSNVWAPCLSKANLNTHPAPVKLGAP